MARYAPEPPYTHGSTPRTAVLLVNLGTPDAPTTGAVRRFLAEFLWDPRVVEIPRPLWWIILNGVVLNFRPSASARKYANIWTERGSPLKVHSGDVAAALEQRLADPAIVVRAAMRYGSPSIPDMLDRLKSEGATRILVIPMYPQYAASTTGSVADALATWSSRIRNLPDLRMLRGFADHPEYIHALAAGIRDHWAGHGEPDRLVMSFHGLPRYTLDRGDPYHCECHKTGRLLAEALDLPEDRWVVSFQSRFGRAQWLQPYTSEVLVELGRRGLRRVDVLSPGFTADCLETLEELGIEGRELFLEAGGGEYHLLPCLNSQPLWIDALAALVRQNGWPTPRPSPESLERSASLAKALGAPR